MSVVESSSYPCLFSTLRLGERHLRNRIAFASMFSARARGGEVTPELIQFYANRAAGGAALIVAEPVVALRYVNAFGAQVTVYQRKDLSGLSRWAESVHEHDSLILAQLQEPGRGDVRPVRKLFAFSSSALPDDLSWSVPHALSVSEIAGIRDDFVQGCTLLRKAGFDGVEISAGHGHLYHQFLSPWMNDREDQYGGERSNRVRVLEELVKGIRDECGSRFLIGVRLPGNDGFPGSIDWEEGSKIADTLTRCCRPDYVNFVQGSQAWTLHQHVPDMHMPRGTYVDDIGRLRKSCNGVPVASTGRILEPAQAEALLLAGHGDFVMLGRTLLADPAWGLKSQRNREFSIRKCVSCNNCWGEIVHHGRPLSCDNNPRVGKADEVDWWPKRSSVSRRVAIVGGGVAGLETAWVCAARGHQVTLFCTSAELGGKARLYASLPGCEAVSSVYDYQISAARRAGVRFELSRKASLSDIQATQPDAVVIAAGGQMRWPAQWPEAWREEGVVLDLWSLIAELPRMRADMGTAVLYDFDGTDVTYSTAEALSQRFSRVVLFNPVECVARDEALVKRQAIYRRLYLRGVELWTWCEPGRESDLEAGRVGVRNVLADREMMIEGVALLAYSTPRKPRDELIEPLQALGIATHVIGDARIPKTAMATVREAHELGESLFTTSSQMPVA